MPPIVASKRSIPEYPAPPGGRLDDAMIEAFADAGVLVLRDFVARDACARLRQRARELVDAFDPGSVRSVFSTTRQSQLGDNYFIESGDKIRFFLEDGAFGTNGESAKFSMKER